MMVTTGARGSPLHPCHGRSLPLLPARFHDEDNFVAHLFSNQLCGFLIDNWLMVAIAPSFIIALMT